MIDTPTKKWYAFVPNLITLFNLSCGVIAIYFAFENSIRTAFLLMIAGAVFDFFDGFAARILKVSGELGKQLDSLADMITFGLLPGVLVFSIQRHLLFESVGEFSQFNFVHWSLLFSALLIPVFSAIRLARFNIDTRQSNSFIGFPTPANALFFASVSYTVYYHTKLDVLFNNTYILGLLSLIFSLLLVSEIPFFALKFKSFKLKENSLRYFFLSTSFIIILFTSFTGISLVILWFIALSLGSTIKTKVSNKHK